MALVVAWCALLVSAAPAWGCAAVTLQGDCCPEGSSAPCPGSDTDRVSSEFANACCVAAPTQAAAAPQVATRVDPDAPPDTGSSDALIFIAAAAAEAQNAAWHARPVDVTAASVHAAPIYLLTSRLRL
jgi:hypothetical protein